MKRQMKYEEFIEELCRIIREVTKDWSGTSVEFRPAPQNDGRTMDLLVVSKKGEQSKGTHELSFHTDKLYEALSAGRLNMLDITGMVIKSLKRSEEIGKISPLEAADNYEEIRSRLIIRPINYVKHMEDLKDEIYYLIGDIALTVYIHIGFVHDTYVSSAVTSAYLEIWHKEKDEILKEAITNTYNSFPPVLMTKFGTYMFMEAYLSLKDKECDMIQVSNNMICNGAVSIFLPGVAKKVCEIMGEDIYIVFLNCDYAIIHSVSSIQPEEIRKIVSHVNSVMPDEDSFLSDMIFTCKYGSDQIEVVEEIYS